MHIPNHFETVANVSTTRKCSEPRYRTCILQCHFFDKNSKQRNSTHDSCPYHLASSLRCGSTRPAGGHRGPTKIRVRETLSLQHLPMQKIPTFFLWIYMVNRIPRIVGFWSVVRSVWFCFFVCQQLVFLPFRGLPFLSINYLHELAATCLVCLLFRSCSKF